MVNRAFAERYWPGGDAAAHAVGRDVAIASSPWLHVIGVVGNVRSVTLTEPPVPELYLSPLQVSSSGEMTLVLRTYAGSTLTAPVVRAAIERLAPTLAVTRMASVESLLADQRRPQRFGAAFLSLLAMLAMALAAAGTYTLVSYTVASRAREIAIRRLLGAGERQIRWRMSSQAIVFLAFGSAFGAVAIFVLSRVYQSVLVGSHVIEPPVVAGAAAVLLALNVLASALPLRRVMRRPLREVLQSD